MLNSINWRIICMFTLCAVSLFAVSRFQHSIHLTFKCLLHLRSSLTQPNGLEISMASKSQRIQWIKIAIISTDEFFSIEKLLQYFCHNLKFIGKKMKKKRNLKPTAFVCLHTWFAIGESPMGISVINSIQCDT